jgi:hypothetical protein
VPRGAAPELVEALAERQLVLDGGRAIPALRKYPWPMPCRCGIDLADAPCDIHARTSPRAVVYRCPPCDLVYSVGAEGF